MNGVDKYLLTKMEEVRKRYSEVEYFVGTRGLDEETIMRYVRYHEKKT